MNLPKFNDFYKDKLSDKYKDERIGPHHHQSKNRMMNMGDRKHLNFVAKSQSRKNTHLHPKVDLCLKIKKNVSITMPEAIDIIKKYSICPTHEEPTKAIKQTGVHIQMVQPNVYILLYKGE